MSLGFLCFSLSNHLNALPAQINLLWHYSHFKNVSTAHGFDSARAVEERERELAQARLPGRAAPTAALAHSLMATDSSCSFGFSIIPSRTPSATASLSAFPYSWRSSEVNWTDSQTRLTVFPLQHMYESP